MSGRREQQVLDFQSRTNELIALASGLARQPRVGQFRYVDEQGKECVREEVLSPGRIAGVVELITRIILLGDFCDDGSIAKTMQVTFIGTAIKSRPIRGEKTIRNWCRDAIAIGVLNVVYRSQIYGGTNWNRYELSVDRIRELVTDSDFFLGRNRAVTAGNAFRPRAGNAFRPIKSVNQITENEKQPDPDPDPVPVAESDPICAQSEKTPTQRKAAVSVEQQVPLDEFDEWCDRVPILREARLRSVEPLEAGRLTYGVFAPLSEQSLGVRSSDGRVRLNVTAITEWFRRQLSVEQPVVGNTQAHLLLVLAAARYALSLRADELKRNRVAAFVNIVSRQRWRRVLSHVPSVSGVAPLEQVRTMTE